MWLFWVTLCPHNVFTQGIFFMKTPYLVRIWNVHGLTMVTLMLNPDNHNLILGWSNIVLGGVCVCVCVCDHAAYLRGGWHVLTQYSCRPVSRNSRIITQPHAVRGKERSWEENGQMRGSEGETERESERVRIRRKEEEEERQCKAIAGRENHYWLHLSNLIWGIPDKSGFGSSVKHCLAVPGSVHAHTHSHAHRHPQVH